MIHPNSLENLKANQFKKGNKGGGRPRGSMSLSTKVKNFLEVEINHIDPLDGTIVSLHVIDFIILVLIAKALQGDIRAMRELFNRIDR